MVYEKISEIITDIKKNNNRRKNENNKKKGGENPRGMHRTYFRDVTSGYFR
jgi:hypothetical protein